VLDMDLLVAELDLALRMEHTEPMLTHFKVPMEELTKVLTSTVQVDPLVAPNISVLVMGLVLIRASPVLESAAAITLAIHSEEVILDSEWILDSE